MRIPLFVVLSLSAATAAADPRVDVAAPVKLDGSPPSITIVQPAQQAQLVTHRTAAPSNKYDALNCLLDAKARVIRVAVADWPVKPGGPGILVVVDGLYSTVVHDATKPISLEKLQPYLEFFTSGSALSPMSSCGWHWVAAVPTTADGRMAPVAPAVSWYFSVPERPGDGNGDASKPPDGPLVIINWPLVGAFVLGEGTNGMQDATGRVASTPDRVPLDYALVNGDGCKVDFAWSSDTVRTEQRALIYIVPSPHDTTMVWSVKCDNPGYRDMNIGHGQILIYSRQPPPSTERSYAWPASGKQKVDEHYFEENRGQVNQQIRHARCNDGHKESCD